MTENLEEIDIVVIGAGPGGYGAAFYAAACGKKVVLIDRDKRLGGVCLNRGCIPSKALLHAAKIVRDAKEAEKIGLHFAKPEIKLDELREWKNSILNKLGDGISNLAKRKGVRVICGRASFRSSDTISVKTESSEETFKFKKAIIATGSFPAVPKAFSVGSENVITSTDALEIKQIPEKLLVVGGGYIGMELGTVYAELGSEVTVVEALDSIMAGADSDLARFVKDYADKNFKEVRTNAKVLKMEVSGEKVNVLTEIDGKHTEELFDQVLVSVGRVPQSQNLGLENTKVTKTDRGFIQVKGKQQTADSNIYAVGDVVGGALLAHKASKEARLAVNDILGEDEVSPNYVLPAVVYTDPEVAWCGLTEMEAKRNNITVQIVKFPWIASGRALTLNRSDGVTKFIVDPITEKILGIGICGVGAGELIGEAVLAIETGATVKTLSNTVHPHPTLSESLMECADMFFGHSASAYSRKRNLTKTN